jgi:hypothetical protein
LTSPDPSAAARLPGAAADSVILVRHAMPVVDLAVPPHEWVLQGPVPPLGLPADPYLAASTEPKALGTLAPFGPVATDVRFGEITRPASSPASHGDGWRELRLAYVEGADHPGWEPRSAVVARFDAGINDHWVRAAGRPLVVASHGMAMTLWLTARISLEAPGVFWSSLRLPDVFAVDLVARTVVRLL